MVYSLISDVSKETLPLLTKLVERQSVFCLIIELKKIYKKNNNIKTPIKVVSILVPPN